MMNTIAFIVDHFKVNSRSWCKDGRRITENPVKKDATFYIC